MHISRQSQTLPLGCSRIERETSLGTEVPVENLWSHSAVSYPWGFIIYGLINLESWLVLPW